ncbi:MAG TPA: hypothetical protein VIH34_03735, partial [Candidatus Bathyarchaeia archaeon]
PSQESTGYDFSNRKELFEAAVDLMFVLVFPTETPEAFPALVGSSTLASLEPAKTSHRIASRGVRSYLS